MKNIYSKSKCILLSIGIILFKISAIAQSNLTIDASQMLTNFKFIGSDGTKDKEYVSKTAGAYSLGYRYNAEKGFIFRTSLGIRKAGATLTYDNTNYSWDLQYTDVKLGVGYMYRFGKVGAYLTASPYFAYLLTANQRLNNQNYDIRKSKSIQNTDYGVLISPGVNFKVNDNIAVYGEFSYLMGLQNLEPSNTKQKAYNQAYSISLGLAFTIKNNKIIK